MYILGLTLYFKDKAMIFDLIILLISLGLVLK
jgi:hypothetical protein